jgi:hypothetical protein
MMQGRAVVGRAMLEGRTVGNMEEKRNEELVMGLHDTRENSCGESHVRRQNSGKYVR